MNDYTKLVEDLRVLQDKNSLSYYKRQVCKDAADAIEELRKVNCELREIYEDAVRKLPKRGEWIRVRGVDIPGEIHPTAFMCMCSNCRNEYVFPKIPQYCPDCGSMNTAKMEVQDGQE